MTFAVSTKTNEKNFSLEETSFLNLMLHPGSIFVEIRRYFSNIAGSSDDTAAIMLRCADAHLS